MKLIIFLSILTSTFACNAKPGHYCQNGREEECNPGNYCPGGTTPIQTCGLGYFCPNFKMTEPFSCNQGYYCPLSTNSKSQEVCPIAYYCPYGGM